MRAFARLESVTFNHGSTWIYEAEIKAAVKSAQGMFIRAIHLEIASSYHQYLKFYISIFFYQVS